jgi:hypothetical protein
MEEEGHGAPGSAENPPGEKFLLGTFIRVFCFQEIGT